MSDFENVDGSLTLRNLDSFFNKAEDNPLYDKLKRYYALALSEAGLNNYDQIYADLFYTSRSGKIRSDPPLVGRTIVFITRPMMNISSIVSTVEENKITLIPKLYYPFIRNYYTTRLGKLLMCYLSSYEYSRKYILPEDSDGFRFNKPVPFVPFLTNLCTSITGGPDLIIDTYETEGDLQGNKLTYAAGSDEFGIAGEITLNFRDLYGSPIMHYYTLALMYMHGVTKGIINPEERFIIERIIDYTSSIYVFMLGLDGESILRYAKFTGCFPKSVPYGNILHNRNPDIESLADVQITYQYNFFEPMNPEIFIDFNNISFWHYLNYAYSENINYKVDELFDKSGNVNNKKVGIYPYPILDPNENDIFFDYKFSKTIENDKVTSSLYGTDYVMAYPFVTGNKLKFITADGVKVRI